MKRTKINIRDLILKSFNVWENEWFLLTAGSLEKNEFNTMTVAWGSIGSMWSKPFVQVVVRPSRYTLKFMDKYDTFTLCRFPKEYKKALTYLGSTSGRDVSDKHIVAGLTPIAVPGADAPGFDEADLILACKKNYWQDMDETHFLDDTILPKYPGETNFHRIYFGEIVHCEIGD
ncbi:MAG: flavin reductase family protein [Candidatus Marinimicrobia bacterium]|nr:flavin reductase family protein [Candidatus Neomarinimicrobiota bacterium]